MNVESIKRELIEARKAGSALYEQERARKKAAEQAEFERDIVIHEELLSDFVSNTVVPAIKQAAAKGQLFDIEIPLSRNYSEEFLKLAAKFIRERVGPSAFVQANYDWTPAPAKLLRFKIERIGSLSESAV